VPATSAHVSSAQSLLLNSSQGRGGSCPSAELPRQPFLASGLKKSYVTTDGQSASLSQCLGGPRHCQESCGLLTWGALYGERAALPFTITAGPRQRSHSRTLGHILLPQIRDSPQPGGPGPPGFMSLGNRLAHLCPQALCSLFVAS
jgi:hypothetical protein